MLSEEAVRYFDTKKLVGLGVGLFVLGVVWELGAIRNFQ